jgi:hypothetical protein
MVGAVSYNSFINVAQGQGLAYVYENGQTIVSSLAATWPQIVPSMSVGPAAGPTGTVLVIGTNDSMRLQVTTDSSPTSGVLFTIQYSNPNNLNYSTNIHPIFSPANAAAASVMQANQIFLEIANTTNGFTLNVGSGKLAKSTVYIWNVISNLTLASIPLN